jgi:beta-glucosidase
MDYALLFLSGVNIAATWDRGLMKKHGEAMGEEFRGKGVNVAYVAHACLVASANA